MRIRIGILTVLVFALCVPAFASAPIEARDYIALRKKLLTQLSMETLSSSPSEWVGKVFEIRGSLAGLFAQEDGSCTLIVRTDNDSHVVSADVAPMQSPGAELACLVKIGPGSTCSLSDLRLVACTHMASLQRLEEAAIKPAAPQVQPAVPAPSDKIPDRVTSEELVAAYKKAVKQFNPKLSDTQADTITRSVLGFSYRYKVDPRLVCAVILAESHFRIGATSSAGAQGLGQLMPSTAAGLGVNNSYDPVENVYGSVRYIRSMFDRLTGKSKWEDLTWYDLAIALAGYNAGPGAVKKHGGIPPYRETQNYVRKVVSIYKQLCGVN